MSSGSAEDPFKFVEAAPLPTNRRQGNRNSDGKAIRDPRLITGEATGVFIIAGQSLASNYAGGSYSPTHAGKIDNLSIYDGGLYGASGALLGCDTDPSGANASNVFLRVADKLIAGGLFDRVILVPVSIGGTSIGNWNTDLYRRIVAAHRRAAARNLPVTGVLWQQGEDDTYYGTSQSAYAAGLSGLISKIQAESPAPFLVAKSTYIGGATSSAVRAAVAAAINGTTVLAGPDTDTLTSSYRYDDTHWTGSGADAASSLWRDAISAAGL